jgi:hypothetical protein
LLVAFGAAAKQDDQRLAIFGKVDSVTWPLINDVFAHATKPLDAGRVAQLHAKLANRHLGCSLRCQAVKPLFVWVRCILADVFFDFDWYALW